MRRLKLKVAGVPLESEAERQEAKLRPERCFPCGGWAKPPAKTIIVVHKACIEKLREAIEAGTFKKA